MHATDRRAAPTAPRCIALQRLALRPRWKFDNYLYFNFSLKVLIREMDIRENPTSLVVVTTITRVN